MIHVRLEGRVPLGLILYLMDSKPPDGASEILDWSQKYNAYFPLSLLRRRKG
jgi:hypothetical protein